MPSSPNTHDAGNGKKKLPDKKEKKEIQDLLASADGVLSQVDASYIMSKNDGPRQYPKFDLNEVVVGPLLGVGGFCLVSEVEGFQFDLTADHSGVHEDEALDGVEADDTHYDPQSARSFMAENVRRKTDARYAIKKLDAELSELARVRGMIDLALEAKYLSVMWHPNIVKMRGFASGPMLNPSFFILMDRLYETLDVKIQKWTKVQASNKGGLFGRGANVKALRDLLLERLIVAYDLSTAFSYMHENRVVYRDIKQENIGFDVRGDVKVFDFGLSKSLSEDLKARDRKIKSFGYNLTPRTGSVPYMAPEVVECKPYDTKCDVFSFAILLWEILSLKQAFKGYTKHQFLLRVAQNHERPSVSRKWPALTILAMKEAWRPDPQARPDMTRVSRLLRGDMNEISSSSKVRNRSFHMQNRSAHSRHFRLHSPDSVQA